MNMCVLNDPKEKLWFDGLIREINRKCIKGTNVLVQSIGVI